MSGTAVYGYVILGSLWSDGISGSEQKQGNQIDVIPLDGEQGVWSCHCRFYCMGCHKATLLITRGGNAYLKQG
jgi:hypothetical protein